jgi:hypothetical protein
MKGVVVGRDMHRSIVAMLDIGKALIPCARVLGIIHAQSFDLRPRFGHLSGGGRLWIW